jgi:two-component system CheB/CheR fusion protein
MSGAEPFPIVGVGASAGGVEALEGLFQGLPDDPGLALVIVTHLSPRRESLLHEIIGRYTHLPVHVATDSTLVEPNNVYVLPSDAVLSIQDGLIRLDKPKEGRRERKPIDIFFSSLAADRGELAIGIVLSGGDSDGTLGIKAIKERGGLTLAQVADGHGPNHPDMPDSAISTGFVDFAIPVEEMGSVLVDFTRSLRVIDHVLSKPSQTNGKTSLEQARSEIYNILRSQVGHDFSGYKSKTFLRRVQRRMQVTQNESVAAYIERLRQEPQEVRALFRDLLINVTNFFRDADAFEALAKDVLPELFEGHDPDDAVRVWVPGCSTGEEVFSLGILLREHIDGMSPAPRVQIFATDIDERSLGVARAARYPAALLDSVSAERRKRFFIEDGGSYVVSKEIREMCIFSPHSVIRDPPFSRMDLISCRNLLIYFGLDAQNQVIPTFHYALRPNGFLFLGSSENVSQFADLFESLEKKHRIFRRRADTALSIRLPLTLGSLRVGRLAELKPRRAPLGAIALRQLVDGQVLDRFAPPHVVVNRDSDIVYFSGHTGKYLEAASGSPTRQLLTMARRGLQLDIRNVFREVVETGRPATRENIAIEGDDGRVQIIRLVIEPLHQFGDNEEPLFLILFIDQGPTLSREEALGRTRLQDGGTEQLERELRDTRERLQSVIEEYETALEELKSSNEELVSLNEELQSTNEELEASKEELVSLNEELHTVNTELSGKVDELDRANSDLQNLFDSTEIATVFLDQKLLIRSFTPPAANIFNILPSDRGRPITDLSSRINLSGFAEDIAKVMAQGEPVERRAEDQERSAHYLVRLSPYRDGDLRTKGVVACFLNVSSLTRAEARQRVLIAELQHRTRNLLAVVQSIARQTLKESSSRDDFHVRLRALSRVQGLLSRAVDERVDIGELMELELSAHAADSAKITISGPPVPLRPSQAQTMALALHELATNALKYGALNAAIGHLSVTWALEPRPDKTWLVLVWSETGVTMPSDNSKHGFGRKLIEEALTHTLGARTELEFGADGVSCRIEIPLVP